jgi:hypothetical protein
LFPRIGHKPNHGAAAIFAGAIAFPAPTLAHIVHVAPHPVSEIPAAVSPAPEEPQRELPSQDCLASTICEIKDRVRWRSPAWKPEFCQTIAREILESAKRYQIPPALILAVMINESDMNETTFRTTVRDGSIYAKDGGLMGLRCIVDKQGKCTNAHVRGMSWKEVMKPTTNIEIGTRTLAHYRDGGGVNKVTMRVRDGKGQLVVQQKSVPCTHKTHAYWAHYNHGPHYIDHGSARHYPHRIGVLYYALARTLGVDTTEVTTTRLTVIDRGRRPRTYDRPIEARYHKLCQAIRDSKTACTEPATASLH